VKMLGGVTMRRRVTTANVAAGHAQTQVHPLGADAQAVFTTTGAGLDWFYLIEMCTYHVEFDLLPELSEQ
jgi:hypothetical protein